MEIEIGQIWRIGLKDVKSVEAGKPWTCYFCGDAIERGEEHLRVRYWGLKWERISRPRYEGWVHRGYVEFRFHLDCWEEQDKERLNKEAEEKFKQRERFWEDFEEERLSIKEGEEE